MVQVRRGGREGGEKGGLGTSQCGSVFIIGVAKIKTKLEINRSNEMTRK